MCVYFTRADANIKMFVSQAGYRRPQKDGGFVDS